MYVCLSERFKVVSGNRDHAINGGFGGGGGGGD